MNLLSSVDALLHTLLPLLSAVASAVVAISGFSIASFASRRMKKEQESKNQKIEMLRRVQHRTSALFDEIDEKIDQIGLLVPSLESVPNAASSIIELYKNIQGDNREIERMFRQREEIREDLGLEKEKSYFESMIGKSNALDAKIDASIAKVRRNYQGETK